MYDRSLNPAIWLAKFEKASKALKCEADKLKALIRAIPAEDRNEFGIYIFTGFENMKEMFKERYLPEFENAGRLLFFEEYSAGDGLLAFVNDKIEYFSGHLKLPFENYNKILMNYLPDEVRQFLQKFGVCDELSLCSTAELFDEQAQFQRTPSSSFNNERQSVCSNTELQTSATIRTFEKPLENLRTEEDQPFEKFNFDLPEETVHDLRVDKKEPKKRGRPKKNQAAVEAKDRANTEEAQEDQMQVDLQNAAADKPSVWNQNIMFKVDKETGLPLLDHLATLDQRGVNKPKKCKPAARKTETKRRLDTLKKAKALRSAAKVSSYVSPSLLKRLRENSSARKKKLEEMQKRHRSAIVSVNRSKSNAATSEPANPKRNDNLEQANEKLPNEKKENEKEEEIEKPDETGDKNAAEQAVASESESGKSKEGKSKEDKSKESTVNEATDLVDPANSNEVKRKNQAFFVGM